MPATYWVSPGVSHSPGFQLNSVWVYPSPVFLSWLVGWPSQIYLRQRWGSHLLPAYRLVRSTFLFVLLSTSLRFLLVSVERVMVALYISKLNCLETISAPLPKWFLSKSAAAAAKFSFLWKALSTQGQFLFVSCTFHDLWREESDLTSRPHLCCFALCPAA